jgi:hypothetical protein
MRFLGFIMIVLLGLTPTFAQPARPPRQTPEERALAYLAREVPRWPAKNHCYSCHNNGDGARALYTGVKFGNNVPAKSLTDTFRWLAHPEKWDHIGDKAKYSDKKLARLQFAAALAAAADAGRLKDRNILKRAAKLVAEGQDKDGSWQIDAQGNIGSPATYGAYLATALARNILHQADAKFFRKAIARADHWLRQEPVRNVFAAAGVLVGLANGDDAAARVQRKKCLALIRKGQSRDGGWGPYVNSPSEPFDTALVILALATSSDKETKATLERGRKYLLSVQQADGSWPATTRPAGSASYAQHISTTAWATLALLRSSKRRE